MASYYDSPIFNIRNSYPLLPPSTRNHFDRLDPPLHPPPSYDPTAPPYRSPAALSPVRSPSTVSHQSIVAYADHPAYSPPCPTLARLWRSFRRQPERLDSKWHMPNTARLSRFAAFESGVDSRRPPSANPHASVDPPPRDLALTYEERIARLNEEIPKALVRTRFVLSCLEISAYIWIALLVVSLAAGKGQQTVGFIRVFYRH
jgi:hypothetical protein